MCASILLFTLGLNGIEKTNSVKVSKSLSEKSNTIHSSERQRK